MDPKFITARRRTSSHPGTQIRAISATHVTQVPPTSHTRPSFWQIMRRKRRGGSRKRSTNRKFNIPTMWRWVWTWTRPTKSPTFASNSTRLGLSRWWLKSARAPPVPGSSISTTVIPAWTLLWSQTADMSEWRTNVRHSAILKCPKYRPSVVVKLSSQLSKVKRKILLYANCLKFSNILKFSKFPKNSGHFEIFVDLSYESLTKLLLSPNLA